MDADSRHAKMLDAQKTCWELPRERVFEAAKEAIASYRSYQTEIADLEKGRIETYPRDEEVPAGELERRHRLVVQLLTEDACTKVLVTAPIEVMYDADSGAFTEIEEQSYGIRYDATLKIDGKLKAMK